jgi:hypothetical protein
MSQLKQFHDTVEGFLAESHMLPTAFGREAVGDPCFVWDLRAGRAPRLSTVDRVLDFIAARRSEAFAQLHNVRRPEQGTLAE